MSFWVHAFCHRPVDDVTPEILVAGIRERLKSLTYLFCPEDEEEPSEVAARLRVEVTEPTRWRISYRSRSFMPTSFHGRDALDELETEILPGLRAPALEKVKPLLAAATCDVSFDLKPSDVRGMGFPVAIAAAATFVARAGGVIQSGNYSWMVPSGKEVDIICEINAARQQRS
jgi:hypothetical protein